MTMLDPSFLRLPAQRDLSAEAGAKGETPAGEDGEAFRALLEKVKGTGGRSATVAETVRDAVPARSLRALVERLGETLGAGGGRPVEPGEKETEDRTEGRPDREGGAPRGDNAAGLLLRESRAPSNETAAVPLAGRAELGEAMPADGAAEGAPAEPKSSSSVAATRIADLKQGFGVTIASQKERPLPKMTVLGRETHFEPVGTIKPKRDDAEPVADPAPRSGGRSERLPPVTARDGGGEVLRTANVVRAGSEAEAPLPVAEAGKSEGLPGPTLQRLGERLAGEVRSLTGASQHADAAPAATAPQHGQQQAGGPVRVLNIQLHPAELGSVTVRMRLVGDSIEVELRASDPRTVRMLQNDSDALSGVLRSAGYRPEVVTLQVGAADPGQSAGQSAQQGGQQAGQGQQAFSGDASGGGRGTSRGEGRSAAPTGQREGEGHASQSQDRGSGGIYL